MFTRLTQTCRSSCCVYESVDLLLLSSVLLLHYRLFEGSSVEEILEKLQKDQSAFAQKQVEVCVYGHAPNALLTNM